MVTTQEQLDEVNSAITAIMTGSQEYRIGHRLLKRGDLNVLKQMRQDLETKLYYEQNGNITIGISTGR